MPRGFLVKRREGRNHSHQYSSYRQRHNSSEEDRVSVHSDSGSEPDHINTQYGSPDSGISQSPINLTFKPDDSVPQVLGTTRADEAQINGTLLNGNPVLDNNYNNHVLSNSFKREQLQIKFKLLDNYGFGSSITSGPNAGVINYSNKSKSCTIVKPQSDSDNETENNANFANTKVDATSKHSEKVSEKLSNNNDASFKNLSPGQDHDKPPSRGVHEGLLQTYDQRDLINKLKSERKFPGSHSEGSAISLSQRSLFSEHSLEQNIKNHLQLLKSRALAAAAVASSVSSLVSPSSPPLSVSTASPYGSPLYFSAFNRLSVSSPTGRLQQQESGHTSAGPAGTTASSTSSGSARSSPAPSSPNKRRASGDFSTPPKTKSIKKPKSARKIRFEEDKSSPISGTIIKEWSEEDEESNGKRVVCGDIDSNLNFVEATPEARAELEKIENKIGDFICQLCKEFYTDAFTLASHRCSRIVHVEYRCPECDKVFNCPANLASHRRWHKPRPNGPNTKSTANSTAKSVVNDGRNGLVPGMTLLDRQTPSPNNAQVKSEEAAQYECVHCGKKFKRQAYLRKHMANHGPPTAGGAGIPTVGGAAGVPHTGGVAGIPPARSAPLPIPGATILNGGARHVMPPQLPSLPPSHTTALPLLSPVSDAGQSELYECKYCSSTFYSSPGLTRHINKCHPTENRQVILLQMPVSPRTC